MKADFLSIRVKKALDLTTQREVAVKILKTSDRSPNLSKRLMLESFFNEVNILSHCRHPNIVKLLDASLNGTLIMERTSGK